MITVFDLYSVKHAFKGIVNNEVLLKRALDIVSAAMVIKEATLLKLIPKKKSPFVNAFNRVTLQEDDGEALCRFLENLRVNTTRVDFRLKLESAKVVSAACKKNAETLTLPLTIKVEDFHELVRNLDDITTKVEWLANEHSEAIKKRNKLVDQVWELVLRIRSAAKATYGESMETEETRSFYK